MRDPAGVEDVTQEAFIKAYRALPGFRGDSAFYHVAVSDRDQHGEELPGRAGAAGADVRPVSTNEEAEGFEDAEQLRDSATLRKTELIGEADRGDGEPRDGRLPEDLRTAITLRGIEEPELRGIASVMNLSIGTVRSRIFRAREAICAAAASAVGTGRNRRW